MDTTTKINDNFDNDRSMNETLVGKDGTSEADVFRFTHEGDKPQAAYTSDTVPRQMMETVADPVSHEIADFCRRPWRIATFDWTNSGTGNVLVSAPTNLFKNSEAWLKLRGFYAFNATFCFKLVTNSQPTQSGVALMTFVPDGTALNPFSTYAAHPGALLVRDSCLPSVAHNIAAVSESELRVAYRGVRPFLSIQSMGVTAGSIDFGHIKVTNMARLRGPTDAEKINCSLYMWLEDLKTYGTAPTNNTNAFADATYQGHVARDVGKTHHTKRAPPAVKEAAMKSGPVSSGASAVADIADVLTAIPGISDVAGPVSWAARGVAQIASLLGYSKPHDITPSVAMTINPFKDFAHGTGAVANDTKLTLNDDQEVSVRSLGPTDDDEMNINYLLKRPCFYFPNGTDITWDTSQAVGTVIYTTQVRPSAFEYIVASEGTTADYIAPTTLAYMARYFRFWRGTINLTFVVSATKFHSGRLRAQFVPRNANQDIQWEQQQHIYTHIIDLRDANTFTIQIPFVSLTPWLRTIEYTGDFRLTVETPLITHPSTSNTIDLLTYVSATDFQFACPYIDHSIRNMNSYNLPVADSSDPSGVHDDYVRPTVAEYQGFTDTVANEAPAKTMITNEVRVIDPTSAFVQCIGDPVVSLRTLVKRLTFNTQIKASATNAIAIQCNALQPGYIHPINGTAGDYVDFVCSMFLFRSGGMRFALHGPFDDKVKYKFAFDSPYLLNTSLKVTTPGSAAIIGLDTYRYRYSPGYTEVPYSDKLTGALQFECPYYSRFPFLRNGRDQYATLTPPAQVYSSIVNDEISDVNSVILTPNSSNGTYTLYRAGADDFNAGFFIGPPLLKVYRSAALVIPDPTPPPP